MKKKLTILIFATFFLMVALIMLASDWQGTIKALKASVGKQKPASAGYSLYRDTA